MTNSTAARMQCSTCGRILRYPVSKAGAVVKCPRCSDLLRLRKPDASPLIAPEPDVEPQPGVNQGLQTNEPADWDAEPIEGPAAIREFKAFLATVWPGWIIGLGLFAWLYFSVVNSQNLPLFCYPSIALAGVGGTVILSRRSGPRTAKWIGIPITLAAVVAWGYFDTYESTWHNENVRFTDTYSRWGGNLVYRDLDIFENEARQGLPVFSEEGPMAGTGRPHGEWKVMIWKPDLRSETQFYWYGEEIDEGEWYLRNR